MYLYIQVFFESATIFNAFGMYQAQYQVLGTER